MLHREPVPAGDDAYLVLCEGKANSRGSSRAFQVIMEEMEIPCKISNYRRTYCNIVNVDGQWYNIRCYDDTLVSSSSYNSTDLEKRFEQRIRKPLR